MVGVDEFEVYIQHFELAMAESGRDGDPIFTPYSPDEPPDLGLMRERRESSLSVPVGEPGWRRAWGAFDGKRVVGDLELEGGSIATNQHRAGLSMGVQRPYRGQGIGGRLLATAIVWAREQGLSYVDLGVFAGNEPAMRLYRKHGFEAWGTHGDAFRVEGKAIDDIQMVLKL